MFSREPLFHNYYRKIDSSTNFDPVSSHIGRFNRKMKKSLRFSIIKTRISIIFMHLQSKPTLKICQKIICLGKKTEQNGLKVPTLLPFLHETTTFIEKQETLIYFLL